GRLQAQAQGPRHALLDGGPRALGVQRDLAAEQMRRNTTQHEMRVGDRGLLAAGAVADGAGLSTRALGTDGERAILGDARERAATGADGVDVDHGNVQRTRAHASLDRDLRLATAE